MTNTGARPWPRCWANWRLSRSRRIQLPHCPTFALCAAAPAAFGLVAGSDAEVDDALLAQGPRMVQPLKKVKVVHKHKGKFIRHQSDTNVSVKVSALLATG